MSFIFYIYMNGTLLFIMGFIDNILTKMKRGFQLPLKRFNSLGKIPIYVSTIQTQRLRTTATILLQYALGILLWKTDLNKSIRIVIIRFIKTVIRFVLCKHSAARQSYQSAYIILLYN